MAWLDRDVGKTDDVLPTCRWVVVVGVCTGFPAPPPPPLWIPYRDLD